MIKRIYPWLEGLSNSCQKMKFFLIGVYNEHKAKILIIILNILFIPFLVCYRTLLKQFDPACFQNVILGVVAVYVALSIQLLAESNSGKSKEKFERLVIFNEVIKFRCIAISVILGLLFFAFFSNESSLIFKNISIIVLELLVFLVFLPSLIKISNFITGKKYEAEIAFFKNISLRNLIDSEIIVEAITLFWKEKTEYKEELFFEEYLKIIEKSIEMKRYNLCYSLMRSFADNIEKRNLENVFKKFLELSFEKDLFLWKNELLFSKNNDKENAIILDLYIQANILPELLKLALGSPKLLMIYFGALRKYLNDISPNEVYNEMNFQQSSLRFICPAYFNSIKSLSINCTQWSLFFLEEWKFTIDNLRDQKSISWIWLINFMCWLNEALISDEKYKESCRAIKKLSNILFPNIDLNILVNFFILIFFDNIQDLLKVRSYVRIYSHTKASCGGDDFYNTLAKQKEENLKNIHKLMDVIVEKMPANYDFNRDIKIFMNSFKLNELYDELNANTEPSLKNAKKDILLFIEQYKEHRKNI